MSGRKLALFLAAAFLCAVPMQAQTDQSDERASSLPPSAKLTPRAPTTVFAPEKGANSSQLVGYFAALLALAGAGLYFMKRGLPLRGTRMGENHLHLLETKMLGNRQFLVVVKYEDSKMLLGVGPGQIQYLCALDSADEDMARLIRKSGPAQGPGLA